MTAVITELTLHKALSQQIFVVERQITKQHRLHKSNNQTHSCHHVYLSGIYDHLLLTPRSNALIAIFSERPYHDRPAPSCDPMFCMKSASNVAPPVNLIRALAT